MGPAAATASLGQRKGSRGARQAARCMGAGPATCRSPHRSAEASGLLAGHVVPRALTLRSLWPFSCSSTGRVVLFRLRAIITQHGAQLSFETDAAFHDVRPETEALCDVLP